MGGPGIFLPDPYDISGALACDYLVQASPSTETPIYRSHRSNLAQRGVLFRSNPHATGAVSSESPETHERQLSMTLP